MEQLLGHGEWTVPVLNPNGRGQWYCHLFRGCQGHVAHPLACSRGCGWRQAAGRSGRCCDGCPVECQSKHREARWGQGGAVRRVKWVWEISVLWPCPLKRGEGEGGCAGSAKERCQDIGSHSAASRLWVFEQVAEQLTSEESAVWNNVREKMRSASVSFHFSAKLRGSFGNYLSIYS